MGNEIITKVDEYVQAIADTLGVAAEHVYGVLVKQAVVDGIMYVSIGTLALIILAVVAWNIYAIYAKAKYRYEEMPSGRVVETPDNLYANIKESKFVEDGGLGIVGGVATVICVLLAFALIPDGISRIVNPEYYAIQEILSVFSK